MENNLPVVQKRNGCIEEYIPEKFIVSLIKNGITPSAARAIEADLRKEVTGKRSISTIELAYYALTRLRNKGKPYYQSWIYYDINHKRRRIDYDIKHILGKSIDA
ncbi:MAG: hypothetical protein F7B60_04045 [Desulfurococcales archaeon]|nr:hypothetical protein [Desulfurococcales archaeon]